MDHLRDGVEFGGGETRRKKIQYIFLERELELASNSNRFIFFGALWNYL